MNNKFQAFTLAEVLITLGIIGVVAAMTLPTLMANNQKKQFQAGLNKGYSTILQAMDMYKQEHDIPLISEDMIVAAGSGENGKFKRALQPYLNVIIDCGNLQGSAEFKNGQCLRNSYYNFDGKSVYKTYSGKNANEDVLDDGQLVLNDGSILLFENQPNGNPLICVSIDVNGVKKGPNRWGYDLFTFQLMEDGKLLPMGADGTIYNDNDYCSGTSTSNLNGIGCTSRALYDKNYWK